VALRPTKTAARQPLAQTFEAQQAQRQAQMVSRQVNACPFVTGVMRSVTFVAATAKVVNHGLGSPAAFFVARHNYDSASAYPRIVESAPAIQAGIDTKNQMFIVADAACTVDLWFYPLASKTIDTATGQSK
jgi:hypothetical protein